MKIIFSNRFYWPEEPATAQLLCDLAEQLALRHEVVVVTGRSPGLDRSAKEVRNRVRIVRVRTGGGRGILGKLVAFVGYAFSASLRLATEVKRGDVLVCLTDPPLFGVAAACICEAKGAHLVHWVQDIYPEIAARLSGKRVLMALAPPRNGSWKSAALCVTLGEDMAQVLRASGVSQDRLAIIQNWAPDGLGPDHGAKADALRAKWSLGSRFVLMYSGNIGRVHAIEPVIELAESLRSDVQFAVVMVGHGARRPALEAEASTRGLDNFHFHPQQPRAELTDTLSLGDLHLVTLRADCANYVFPSKFYGILAVGRPVAFIGPTRSELARLIEIRGIGRAFEPDEMPALADFARALSTDPALRARYQAAATAYSTELGGLREAARSWERALAASLDRPYSEPRS